MPRLLFLHALSPLHAGTGQSTGAIELAVARDRATGYPLVPGSSIKGSLRDVGRQKLKQQNDVGFTEKSLIEAFGPKTANAADHAGMVLIGDANLLLLPVRSISGTFAWVTSPLILRRLARDAKEAGVTLPEVPEPWKVEACMVGTGTAIAIEESRQPRKVVFEDLDLEVGNAQAEAQTQQRAVDELAKVIGARLFAVDNYWQGALSKRLCVVHDEVMTYLARYALEVVTRVALKDETKTVENFWHEESLPVESVLVSLVEMMTVNDHRVDDAWRTFGRLATGSVQLGGKATVGRGRCRMVLCER